MKPRVHDTFRVLFQVPSTGEWKKHPHVFHKHHTAQKQAEAYLMKKEGRVNRAYVIRVRGKGKAVAATA